MALWFDVDDRSTVLTRRLDGFASRPAIVFACCVLLLGLGVTVTGVGLGVAAAPDAAPEPTIVSGDSGSTIAPDDDRPEDESAAESIVVRFEPAPDATGHSPEALEAHADETQTAFVERYADDPAVEIVDRFWLANAILVEIDSDRVTRDDLEATSGVVRTHENFEVSVASAVTHAESPTHITQTQLSSNSTAAPPTYGLEMIGAPIVWEEYDVRGEGATIAVLDSGIDPDRADLVVEEWVEFDADGSRVDSEPHDTEGHGTHVAGTVAGGNQSGTAIGVAPAATLYGVKVVEDTGQGSFAQLLAGLEWATANEEVDVIQASIGATGTFTAFQEPIANARSTGALVVAASGNDGHLTSSSPGNVHGSLSVGAVGPNAQVAPFSSGAVLSTTDDWTWRASPPEDWPDSYVVPTVSAPGVWIPSAAAGSETALSRSSGTSMAAPHVSGVAALAIAATDGRVDDDELFEAIRETTVHPRGSDEPDDRYGHGIVDALGVVERVIDTAADRPRFEVAIVEANVPVRAGEPLVVETEVTNAGAAEGTDSIELYVDGIGPIDERTVTLGPGETETIELRWLTGADAAGEYTISVASDDDYDSRPVTVAGIDPADFRLELVAVDDRATEGENVTVTAIVENAGDVHGTQEIALERLDPDGDGDLEDVDGDTEGRERVDSTLLLLDAGENETVTLTWGTEPGDAGDHRLAVVSADHEVSVTIGVEPATDETATDDGIAGFGIAIALVAILLAAGAIGARRTVTRSRLEN